MFCLFFCLFKTEIIKMLHAGDMQSNLHSFNEYI